MDKFGAPIWPGKFIIVFPLSFALLFAVFFAFDRRGKSLPQAQFCPHCKRVSNPNQSGRCECGAKTEPFYLWRWVDE